MAAQDLLRPASRDVDEADPCQATDKYPVEPFLESLPIKRMGRSEDLPAMLAFLVSDAAAWVTGPTIHVNGGFWMRPA
jgi:3-oxoacyl-[acyl-carrier protein] reductase